MQMMMPVTMTMTMVISDNADDDEDHVLLQERRQLKKGRCTCRPFTP